MRIQAKPSSTDQLKDFHAANERRLEAMKDVERRTGMGRSWIYAKIAEGAFPKPVKIGGASRWDSFAIDGWIDDRVQQAAE